MAFPPQTLNENKPREIAKQTLWTALPAPVKGKLVEALSVMLSAVLLPADKEESHE